MNHNYYKVDLDENEITILALHLGVGGVEKYILSLSKMLSKKYKIKVVSTYKFPKDEELQFPNNVEIIYLINNHPDKKSIKTAINNKNIKLLFSSLFYNFKIIILKYFKNITYVSEIKSKYVITTRTFHNNIVSCTLNDSYVRIATEHNYHNNDKKYINKLIDSVREFNYLVCVSQTLTDFYQTYLSKTKVVYIPNVIDYIPPYNYDKNINNNIISVGRIEKEKGFEDLIKIVDIISKKNNKIHLYLIGDGSLLPKLKNEAKEFGVEKNITFTGKINDINKLNEFYKESSIYVMTSYTESFGIVLLEAMSNGLPCIGFDCADGAKNLLAENGILVSNRDNEKMANEILNLLGNDKQWHKMSKKGYAFSKEFQPSNVKKQWYKLLK